MRKRNRIEDVEIDLEDVCAESVTVQSWGHAGPVAVTLKGVPLKWLLDKIPENLLSEYLGEE